MADLGAIAAPSPEELKAIYDLKYTQEPTIGWGPKMRLGFNHFNPDDHYEALVAGIVQSATRWVDVGCGRDTFPSNRPLAAKLAKRCARMVGGDPDEVTLSENEFVHEKICAIMNDYRPDEQFDLVTLRMVAEHVEELRSLIDSISHCLESGGHAVIYTVNKYLPVPLLTPLTPHGLRHVIKKVLWNTEERDTFPTAYRMNTRQRLFDLFDAGGFDEVFFQKLDDCRTSQGVKPLAYAELWLRMACNAMSLSCPENCLLGVYRKR